jgi:hypothetical protein
MMISDCDRLQIFLAAGGYKRLRVSSPLFSGSSVAPLPVLIARRVNLESHRKKWAPLSTNTPHRGSGITCSSTPARFCR